MVLFRQAALPRLRAREVDEYRLSAIRGLAALGVLAVAAVLFVSGKHYVQFRFPCNRPHDVHVPLYHNYLFLL